MKKINLKNILKRTFKNKKKSLNKNKKKGKAPKKFKVTKVTKKNTSHSHKKYWLNLSSGRSVSPSGLRGHWVARVPEHRCQPYIQRIRQGAGLQRSGRLYRGLGALLAGDQAERRRGAVRGEGLDGTGAVRRSDGGDER